MSSLDSRPAVVELVQGLSTTRLGLGCSAILGRVAAEQARAGIDRAWSLGVRYFDTAPSYGYGRGEAFLGDRLSELGIAEEATVATKVGLPAAAAARRLSAVAAPVRPLLARSTALRAWVGRHQASTLAPRADADPHAIAASIRTSLTNLRRERLDVVLLHRLPDSDDALDDALAALAAACDDGLVRTFGACAAKADEVVRITARQGVPVLQTYAAVARDSAATISGRPGVVLHSAFSDGLGMAATAALNEGAVILASMYSDAHLRENVAALALAD
ncbi:MAG: aldo/keto reductase [Actinobacteria bacterium]|nr:aldo/keto reductase [Actinomycetota bacterium]MCA1722625.1 aldo/keto reductase [Actinomycetota bacterium]